jgi:TonB family protein
MRTTSIPFALLAITCAAASPAGAQQSAALPANCQAVRPDERPGEAALDSIRSERAIRGDVEDELRAAAREAGITEPRGIVFAEPPATGTGAARVWSYRSNVPDALVRSVVARHAQAVAQWSARNGTMNLRLDHLGAPDTVTRQCTPVLLNENLLVRELRRITTSESPEGARPVRRVTLHMRMLVTRDGEVAYASLRRPSIRRDVDRELLQLARRLRFSPAKIEDVPIDVWVEQPMELDMPVQ